MSGRIEQASSDVPMPDGPYAYWNKYLPGTEHRVIVEIVKASRTDPKYPRPATAAKGKPL